MAGFLFTLFKSHLEGTGVPRKHAWLEEFTVAIWERAFIWRMPNVIYRTRVCKDCEYTHFSNEAVYIDLLHMYEFGKEREL